MALTTSPFLAQAHAQQVQRDACVATAGDLGPLAFAGYAHFTAMQVRAGKVRGLDLHLQRLRMASQTLFGQAMADELIKEQLRAALQAGGVGDVSLTATVYSSAGEFTVGQHEDRLHLLVRTSAPSDGPAGPVRLQLVDHERTLPELKHVGEIAKTWWLRKAVEQGFDDAAFVDAQGRLSEATIWNLAFWDGEHVVWPRAAMLQGTTMSIVMRQLQRMGVAQQLQDIRIDALPGFKGAVVMNSWTPGVAVRRFAALKMPAAPDFVDLLHRAFAQEPLLPI